MLSKIFKSLKSLIGNCLNNSQTIVMKNKSTIHVNGKTYHGKNVKIVNNKVYIDGELQQSEADRVLNVTIYGNVEFVNAEKVDVNGNVEGDVNCQSFTCDGSISGDVDSQSVTCNGNIGGNVDSQSVHCAGDIKGDIEALSVSK